MKKQEIIFGNMILILCLTFIQFSFAQEVKWLCVTSLQEPINSIGASYEAEYPDQLNANFFTWPAQYGIRANDQNTLRMEGLWIGCSNFDDPVMGTVFDYKVIGSGPRNDPDRDNQIFPVELKLIAKRNHPVVTVDSVNASLLDTYDIPDSIDPGIYPDRIVLNKFLAALKCVNSSGPNPSV